MDDAVVQDVGIDLIVAELNRCWEVTHDQDNASKIDEALFETQRDVKMEATFMSLVEGTQFSTVGKCIGDVTISSDQGLRDTARRETCRKQLPQGGDVDRWQLRLRRRHASAGAVGSP